MRVAAIWFPDWPVQAARLESDDALQEPIAVMCQQRIKACSAAAREHGIRRGMKLRHAQALAPFLSVVEDNPDRDGRMFAELAASFDDVAPSVEVLRPGLVAVDVGAAGRFHGGEDTATEMLIDAAARRGFDVVAGVADEISTAIIATRFSAVVPPGESAQFLAGRPISLLLAESALGADPHTVNELGQLGVATLGDLAAVPATAVTTRFGAAGMHLHRIASAACDRRVAPALPTADYAVGLTPEAPIERVDAAAFAARTLTAALHDTLRDAGLVCLRLKVKAELEDGRCVERVWRTREALSESATADRVRWQLDGWLSGGGSGAITSLLLEPCELAPPDVVGELWSAGVSTDAARRVVERVQSQLGIDAVVQPALIGGRGVAERVTYVAFGEQPPSAQDVPWPGAIPAPLPARLGGGLDHPASRATLIDAAANRIGVTAEALLSSTPHALAWGKNNYLVTGWAGPWPVDEGWWGARPNKVARLQVVGTREDGGVHAWLLAWSRGRWAVEAVYG